jgi:tetratricopeptide (TPR) repeat protein
MTSMKGIVAATILSLVVSLPAAAAPSVNDSARGQKLDDLFQQLKTAQTQSAALAAEEQISDIWLDSGDPDINRQMHVAMQAMDELFYDSALKVFTNILVLRPDYAEAWNKRATLYYLVGDYQDSLSDIDRVLALEPRHFGAIAGKGMVLLKMGRQADALAAFKDALAIDPALSNIEMEIHVLEAQQAQKRI